MKIKRKSNHEFEVTSSNVVSLISIDKSGIFRITSSYDGKSIEISKPGEYEFMDTGIEAREFPSKDSMYEGKINFIKLSIGSNDLLCIFSEADIKKDELGSMSDKSILISANVSIKYLKDVVNKLDISSLLLFSDGQNSELISEVQKDFGYDQVETKDSYSYKDTDADVSESNVLEFNVLG